MGLVCGLFVKHLFVLQPPPFPYATHIHKLLPKEEERISFIDVSEVKCPVVQVPVKDIFYFIPMPNVLPID